MMIRVSFGIYKGVPFVAEASGLQHFRPDLRSGCSHDCSPTATAMFHRSKEHVGQAKKPMISLGQKKKMRAWQGLI